MDPEEEVSSMDLADLLGRARQLTAELARRALDPQLMDAVDRMPRDSEEDPTERWGRRALAGHAAGATADSTADPAADLAADGSGDPHADLCADGPADSSSGVPAEAAGRTDEAHVPPGSLPAILTGVEELGRWVDAVRTGLAGHVDRIFDAHADRRDLLGIPEGKCAYRHGPDYLWQVLGIHRAEARRRVTRAVRTMQTMSLRQDHVVPPPLPVLGEVLRNARADPGSVDLVGEALMDARTDAQLGGAGAELIDPLLRDGERILSDLALQGDPVSVRKAVDHWRQRFDALVNPDGAAPTEAQVDAAQGLFYHGRSRANLHRWTLLATDGQHERLKTVVSAASNPRTMTTAAGPAASDSGQPCESTGTTGPGSLDRREPEPWGRHLDQVSALDRRTRGQRELDGLISALTGALALVGVEVSGDEPSAHSAAGPPTPSPTTGTRRVRPQVLVTIDVGTLMWRDGHGTASHPCHPPQPPGGSTRILSEAAYTGPVDPTMIRQLACESDLIPVVLGGAGEVLDLGRSQRLFTRRLRQAIIARDGGCAAPACSIPAPWCEVHHIQHWQRGGPTSVDNGTLLCAHHHHAVHSGAWEIKVEQGVPWFIPARYQDPEQRLLRNRFWRSGEDRPQDGAA